MRRCMSCMQEYEESLLQCPHCGYRTEDALQQKADYPHVLPPETILMGRYIVGCLLRSDGFSHTYVTWDALLEKKVLMEEYFPSACASRKEGEEEPVLEERDGINCFEYGRIAFDEESERLIRNQDVDGIIPVFRCFREKGTSYRVSEYVYDDTLEEILEKREALFSPDVERLMQGLCETIDQMHGRGILHLNLSPACIYTDGEWNARLTGFGYAKAQLEGLLPAGHGAVSEYMAPEYYSGDPLTGPADIYALGVIGKKLYQCVDDIPFRNRSRIRKVLGRALSANPKKRPENASALSEMILPS